jgi:hypothetical protein
VIDILVENLRALPAVPGILPASRDGRPVHLSSVYRWTTVGIRGVVLETIQVGGRRLTSVEALQRFAERLSARTGAGAGNPTGLGGRTVAQRQRAARRAEQALIEKGA